MRQLQGLALLAVTLLLCISARSQAFPSDNDLGDGMPSMNTTIGRNTQVFTVQGLVRDASNNLPMTSVRVDLRGINGQVVGTTFTNRNGTFGFANVTRGSYFVEVREIGYQAFTERVELDTSPAFGINAVLHKIAVAENTPPGSRATVSTRELTMPSKALEAMDKGQQLLYMKSDFAGSIKEFQRAIQAFPNFYEAYTEIGIAYMELHDTPNAETALRKSWDMSEQKFLKAGVLLAQLFSENRRFADAEPFARKAVDLEANSWQANAELGRALWGMGKIDEAEKSAQAAVKLEPDRPELYLLLINIHGRQRNYPVMLKEMDMYLKLDPDGTSAEQVRTMREKVQQAMAKPQSNSAPPEPPEEQPLRPPRQY